MKPHRPYTLEEYNPQWGETFKEVSNKVKKVLGGIAIEIEHIGRAGARQRRNRVELVLGIDPQEIAGAAHDLLHLLAVVGLNAGPGKKGRDAPADERRCVGHGPHDPVGTEPARDALAGNARSNAQVQRTTCVGLRLARRLLEGLRLDRPHDHFGMVQERASLGLRVDVELAGQLGTGLGKRLYNGDVVGGVSLPDQALDDGAGHVASADECDMTVHGFPVVECCCFQIVAVKAGACGNLGAL